MTIHRRLEERLAAWEGSEACLLFGSGYLANLGTIGALAGPRDTIFSDELNHASIVDGCRLSKAEVMVYRHLDTEHLAWSLRRHGSDGRNGGDGRRRLIVTDSVFSMDGDVAPLVEIVELAKEWGARVMVDEAHATGALGPDGRGAVAEAGLEGEVDVVVGMRGSGDDQLPGQYGALADLLDRAGTAGRGGSAGRAGAAAGAPAPRGAAALGRAYVAQGTGHRRLSGDRRRHADCAVARG
jgi:glycine C-acetyltransferase/8-amino-7-oxononanoate synthase